MGSRRGEFEHSRIRVARSGRAILNQSGNIEVGLSEGFTFGNIHGCVEIYDVGGRSVALVADSRTLGVGTGHPYIREIVAEHPCECRAIVTDHA